MSIPNDPVILLSYINTQLRDNYSNLDELCDSLNIDINMIVEKLAAIDYTYDKESNQFR